MQAVEHPRIRAYVERLASEVLGDCAGCQIALDLIETAGPDGRLVAIECNPRATSGIHLYSGTRMLADAMVNPTHEPPSIAQVGMRRQVAPGMLMWEYRHVTLRQFARHMWRLVSSRDVVFSWTDLLPTLMQPFLLTSYYQICRERGMDLPEMFQWDVAWEPRGAELAWARGLLEEVDEAAADEGREVKVMDEMKRVGNLNGSVKAALA